MAKQSKTTNKSLTKSILACIQNGERLLDESYDLEFRNPPSTRFFVIMIAQEEFAKAFILFLVKEKIFLLTPALLQAINNHTCKQLIGVILNYIIMHWEEIEELKKEINRDYETSLGIPKAIISAMELLRYKKIARWEGVTRTISSSSHDTKMVKISDGQLDKKKQSALYIGIGINGQVCSSPNQINDTDTTDELECARRQQSFMKSILNESPSSHRYERAINALKALFEDQIN